MKTNLLLIAAIGTTFLFSSCTKDFICECTHTSSNSTSATVYEVTIKDARKTHAKARCITTEDSYTDTSGAITTYTSSCELK